MGREIERKFLVRDRSVIEGRSGTPIRQGYLGLDRRRTVRVRRSGEQAFITIKHGGGVARAEYEYEIPTADADELLDQVCLQPIVAKRRYAVSAGGQSWVVDVFEGENEGLVVAEVELGDEAERVEPPAWAGDEVTADTRYANARLVHHPYRTWDASEREGN
jgi:CYTH domain-containing protein